MAKSLLPSRNLPFMDRIYFEPMSGCWIWGGGWSSAGYGMINQGGISRYAHRVSYEMHKGQIPDGLTIDHLCRNTACCNPDHLEAVTMGVNIRRGTAPCAVNAHKTHCPKGHPLVDGNVDRKMGKFGPKRECSTCRRARIRAVYTNMDPIEKAAYIAIQADRKRRKREEKRGAA